MSDPSAKEDITDVGDMEIESDGEGQDNDKTKLSQPAPPTAPPPLPPPMLLSPLATPQVQQYTGSAAATSDGYGSGVQQTAPGMSGAAMKVGLQSYQQQQQAYSSMFVDNVYGQQQHFPQPGISGPVRAPISSQGRPMRYPVRGRGFPIPRRPVPMDRTRSGVFRSPGMPMRMPGSRGLRTGLHPLFRPPHNTDGFSADMNNDLPHNTGTVLAEGQGRDRSADIVSQSDPFDVVKNMLLGIAKKTLNQKKVVEDHKDGISSADGEGKEGAHVISVAPVHYSKLAAAGEPPKDVENDDDFAFSELDGAPYSPVAEDGVPFSPTAEDITMENKEESLPSLSSDSPTGDGPEPNMDNPILQALYSVQESPKDQLESAEDDLHTSTTQHSPTSQESTTSPHSPSGLELLRAEESDQEEELTSTDLKNILDQVKSDTDNVEAPPPDSSENSLKPVLPTNIPITSKLTNLLDQIFPQISQSLINRKRKNEEDLGGGGSGSFQQNASDMKTPRLGPPNNSTEPTLDPNAPQLASVAGPPGSTPYRAMQGPYPRHPRPPGVHLRSPNLYPVSQRGVPGRPGYMTGPPRNGPPGAMLGPPRSSGPPGTMSGLPRSTGPPGTMSGPPRSTGPPGIMSGPPRSTGPPGTMSGPRSNGPPGTMSGPPRNIGHPGTIPDLMSGSTQAMAGPPGSISGPPPNSTSGLPRTGPPGNLSGPGSGMAGLRPMYTSSNSGQGPHPTGASPAHVDFRYRTPPLGMGARGHPGGPRLRIGFRPMARGPPQGYNRPMRPRFT